MECADLLTFLEKGFLRNGFFGFHMLALVLVGIALAIKGVIDTRRAFRCLEWPWVNGVVLSSDVKTDADGYSKAAVNYKYSVRKRTYHSNRVFFGDNMTTSWLSRETVATVESYPAGADVAVYYDPDNPQISVLEPQFDSRVFRNFLFAGIAFAIVWVIISDANELFPPVC